MAHFEYKIEKLSAHNYTNWKTVMTSLLMSKGLWPYISAVKMETEIDKQKNEEAKTLMYIAMESNQITSTGSCETAHALWTKLKENNEGAETNLSNTLLAEFLGFRYKKGETIVSYCGRFEIALAKLNATRGADNLLEDSTTLWVFRNSLPKELKTIINTWTLAKPDGKLNELISSLKVQFHMDKLDHDEEKSVALHTEEKRNKPNSVIRQDSTNKQDSNNRQQPMTCTYCKYTGHIWRDCRKLKSDNERKKNFANNKQPQNKTYTRPNQYPQQYPPRSNIKPNSGAFMANLSHEKHTFSQDEDCWIIDSGASSHMSPHAKKLSKYRSFSEPRMITLGDGKQTHSLGKGTFYFRTNDFSGYLLDVLWVPELTENLFSVSSALNQGCDVKFTNNPASVIFLKNGQIKLRGNRGARGLFTIQLEPASQDNPTSMDFSGVTLDEWHQRFGHCSKDAIKELIRKDAITGIKITNSNNDPCVCCAHGKICRAHHPTRTSTKATEENFALHMDTVGPIAIRSLGNNRYFVLATEEYSNYKIIRFIQGKDEVSNAVKEIVTQVEIESKRPVRMILTDNGSEYLNYKLKSWLAERGIIHETSATYTPEQNGLAERANRTIIEGTKTLINSIRNQLPAQIVERLWAEAAQTVVYTTNRLLSPRNNEKTRYELYMGSKPCAQNLKRFGQSAIVRRENREKISKFSSKGERCVFVGYTGRTNTFRFFSPSSGRIIQSCDVIFLHEDAKQQLIDSSREENTISLSDCLQTKPFRSASTSGPEQKSLHGTDTGHTDTLDPDLSDKIMDAQSPQYSNPSPQQHIQETRSSDIASKQHQPSLSSQELQLSKSSLGDVIDDFGNDEDDESDEIANPNNCSSIYKSMPSILSNATITQPSTSTPRQAAHVGPSRRATRSTIDLTTKSLPNILKDANNAGVALFSLENEPMDIKDAMGRNDWPKWSEAIQEELRALEKNGTWCLIDRPRNSKLIKNKWVFKLKRKPNGEIDRYKARLVAKGFTQIENVDFHETYAPVASMTTIRLLFAIASRRHMSICQFDIKTAFLYGDLDEDILMEHPTGISNPNNKVCKLLKSLYGLRQAPRNWNKKFNFFLEKFNLKRSKIDQCLYYTEDMSLLLVIYVDDGIVASRDKNLMRQLIAHLEANFELKVNSCKMFLGLEVTQKENIITLTQTSYIERILERYNMSECNPISTPEEVGKIIPDSAPLPQEYPFKELTGSLLYMVTCTRPDIAHAVSMASRTSKPTMAHWLALKRILRYLKGTKHIGIQFKGGVNELIGFSDADYANDPVTRRSNTGYCIFYAEGLIAWRCQRQPIVTLSTTESEFVAGCDLTKAIIPIQDQLIELKEIQPDHPAQILIDNQSTIKIATNEAAQNRTKHIDVREKYITEQANKKKIVIKHVSGKKQAADILTKGLHKTNFITNRNMLMTLAMVAIISAPNVAETLKTYDPVTTTQSNYVYVKGDARYKLTSLFMNPCEGLFKYSTTQEATNFLIRSCVEYYEKKLFGSISNCNQKPTIGPELKDISPLHECVENQEVDSDQHNKNRQTATRCDLSKRSSRLTTNYATEPIISPSDWETHKKSISSIPIIKRDKRLVPFLVPGLAIGLMMVMYGSNVRTYKLSEANNASISTVADITNKHTLAIQETTRFLDQVMNSIEVLQSWSQDVEDRMGSESLYTGMSREGKGKRANLIKTYMNWFDSQANLLQEISSAARGRKIAPALNSQLNISSDFEKATNWSRLYDCNYQLVNKSLILELDFSIPILDQQVEIISLIPMDIYSMKNDSDGEAEYCWNKYTGPRYMLHNKTNGCMTKLLENKVLNQAVRAQTCMEPTGELYQSTSNAEFWTQEDCMKNPTGTDSRIQIQELDGQLKIYCHPLEIEINGEILKCPELPFTIENHASFKVGNITHKGDLIDHSLTRQVRSTKSMLTKRTKRSPIVTQSTDNSPSSTTRDSSKLKVGEVLSNLSSSLNITLVRIKDTVKGLPQQVNLTQADLDDLFTNPFGVLTDGLAQITQYIKTIGATLGLLSGVLLVLMLVPLIEVALVCIKIIGLPIKLWIGSAHRVSTRIRSISTSNIIQLSKKTFSKKNWKDHYRMI